MSLFKKVSIHPLFYFLSLSAILTGLFKQFIILYFIIIVHEFGHVITSYILGWKIKKIHIYPFGGYTVFNELINKPLKEEFYILISGPIFQILLYLFFLFLFKNNIINTYTYNIFFNYHYTTLIFNLLPIHPLDGSKIVNIFLSNILPFKKTHILTIYISYIFIVLTALILYTNKNIIALLSILLFKVIGEHKDHLFIFNRFLLERYLNNIKNSKNNIIKNRNINKMKKNKNNIFVINNKYYNELEILKDKFTKK